MAGVMLIFPVVALVVAMGTLEARPTVLALLVWIVALLVGDAVVAVSFAVVVLVGLVAVAVVLIVVVFAKVVVVAVVMAMEVVVALVVAAIVRAVVAVRSARGTWPRRNRRRSSLASSYQPITLEGMGSSSRRMAVRRSLSCPAHAKRSNCHSQTAT